MGNEGRAPGTRRRSGGARRARRSVRRGRRSSSRAWRCCRSWRAAAQTISRRAGTRRARCTLCSRRMSGRSLAGRAARPGSRRSRTPPEDCSPGFTGSAGSYMPCTVSTYKTSTGSDACTTCPSNSHHSLQAQASVSACVCDPGYTMSGISCVVVAEENTMSVYTNSAGVTVFHILPNTQRSEKVKGRK